jgi:hypothetical protein
VCVCVCVCAGGSLGQRCHSKSREMIVIFFENENHEQEQGFWHDKLVSAVY